MRGASGEYGCLQFLPTTWRLWSKDVYGEVREQTPVRERYVAYKKIERWLEQGYSSREIALMWNQGHPGACGAGVNKHGVSYDSCAYAQSVLTHLHI